MHSFWTTKQTLLLFTMVDLCVTENDYHVLYVKFFFYLQAHFLRRLCIDFLKTLSHDVGTSAIENILSTFY